MTTDRLTEQAHWDGVWEGEDIESLSFDEGPASETYEDQVLWGDLYPRFLPHKQGAKAIEIGSAPGAFLVELARRMGYEPWGLEYSAIGAHKNRQLFQRHRHNPSHVIQGDFFSDEVTQPYHGSFDVVVSRGFVEHFEDVASVVSRHVDLLKPGGTLAICIPRLRGVYRAWLERFDREDLARHNLEIMRRGVFESAFNDERLVKLYCDYFGGLALRRFELKQTGPAASLYNRSVRHGQSLLNFAFRATLPSPGIRSELLSPYLIYFGRRKAA